MSDVTARSDQPVEYWLADRLERSGGPQPPEALLRGLRLLGRWDLRAYEAVAGMSTPLLDEPMRVISRVADHSKPWLVTAAVLATLGGATGRRAAVNGVAAVAVTSLVVNQPMKLVGARRRPDRSAMGVPVARWVPMPASSSFPSGHTASAAAFAFATSGAIPQLRLPLCAAAVVVGFSRVYTGVHYPGDVIVGGTTGALIGRMAARLGRRFGH